MEEGDEVEEGDESGGWTVDAERRCRHSPVVCVCALSPSNVNAVGASTESNLIVEVAEQSCNSTVWAAPLPLTLHLPTPQGEETLPPKWKWIGLC